MPKKTNERRKHEEPEVERVYLGEPDALENALRIILNRRRKAPSGRRKEGRD